jgi:hypothetical protein
VFCNRTSVRYKYSDDDEERKALEELEQSHRSVFETLRYKQRILRELEEDLLLLERGLVDSQQIEATNLAELDAKESNRLQLQKELDMHSEKVTRVNKQIQRLDKVNWPGKNYVPFSKNMHFFEIFCLYYSLIFEHFLYDIFLHNHFYS